MECLRYAHKNDCPWNTEECLRAAKNNHTQCLRYAYENGCPLSKIAIADIQCNELSFDTKQFLYEKGKYEIHKQ